MTNADSRAYFGIFGFPVGVWVGGGVTGQTKNAEYREDIAVSLVSSKRHRVSTSSFGGEMQAVLYGFEMTRALKGILAELLFEIFAGG